MGESMRKRDEFLREASKLWQKGDKKMRGGEVAFYFAERVGFIFFLSLVVVPYHDVFRRGSSRSLRRLRR